MNILECFKGTNPSCPITYIYRMRDKTSGKAGVNHKFFHIMIERKGSHEKSMARCRTRRYRFRRFRK
ncbi:hypothetical protein EMIT0210MI2_12734 [Priestia megaterium]